MVRKFNTSLAFVDILFNIVLGFFYLLMIAIILINPEKKKKDEESPIDIKSQILISMEWPASSASDVDLFVQLPNKQIVYYGNKQVPASHLDRDDLGTRSDTILMPDGTKHVVRENWENTFLTKLMPGWYTVNILMFHKMDKGRVPVKVKVQQFKPYKLILHKRSFLTYDKEEITQISFLLDKKGNVIKTNDDFKSLARKMERSYND